MPQATISNPGDRSKPLASPGSLNTSPLKRPRYTISEDQTKDRDVRKKRVLAFSKRHCPTSPPKRQPVPSGDSAPIRPPPLPPWIQNQNGPGQRVDGTQQPSEDPEKEFKDLCGFSENQREFESVLITSQCTNTKMSRDCTLMGKQRLSTSLAE